MVIINEFIEAIKNKNFVINIGSIINFILGHKSLLNSGIFYRNISIGNIMLIKNENNGFFIDFDFAIKISNNQTFDAPGKTGIKIFITIGALFGEPYSFIHDLEFFFWVFFWICIYYNGLNKKGEVKRRVVPKYEKWNYVDTEELAVFKILIVEEERFDKIIADFTFSY